MPDEPLTWTNRDAIAKFNRKRGVPKNGSQLILPDIGQVHTVIGVKFWRYANRFPRTQIGLVMESYCAVCQARYEHHLGWRLRHGPIRTCEAHRGTWRSPAPQVRRRQPARFRESVAALLLRSLTSGSVPLLTQEAAVQSLVAGIQIPLCAKRDSRSMRVRLALRQLIERNALPKGVRLNAQGDFFYDP